MTKKQPALGRGIGALLGDTNNVRSVNTTQTEAETYIGVTEIALDDIQANPEQPRTHFNEDALRELADSIKVHGLIQPITVRETGKGRYQIISGERRFRASRIAGLETVPVYIRTADDRNILEMALAENIQREDLDAIEIAISFQRLIDECALTQELLSERVGKKRATVANYLRLLTLPAEIQVLIRDRKLSMGHARALAGLNDEKQQRKIARKIIDEDLSVRKVEELVKNITNPAPVAPSTTQEEPELPENYFRLVEVLAPYFNNNVNVKRNKEGKGEIIIHFSNDDEVTRFLQKLNEKQV